MTAAPRYMLDTSVPLVAQGGPHASRDVCRAVLEMAANRRVELHASVEMIQEFVFHRLRMTGDPELAVAQGEALRQFVTLAPFDESVLNAAQGLVRRGHARGRDAVHAATARDRGIDAIVTTDPDFGRVPGLRATAPETLVSTLSDGPA